MTDLRPVVNGDDNSWGTKLLTFLGVHANTDGTLKSSAVQSALGGSQPDIVAARPTGVAATDTAALQAAIDATPTGGALLIPGHATDKTQPYLINAALTVTKHIRIEGAAMSEGWTSSASGGSLNHPASLLGAVIKQVTAATDVMQFSGSAISVRIRNLGLTFDAAIKDTNTGHGINAYPSLVNGSGHDSGLIGFVFENVSVLGCDGNHYGMQLRNTLYGFVAHFRSFGGGGILVDCDSFVGNFGNMVFDDTYCEVVNAGTADAYRLQARTARGSSTGHLNLCTFIRPQANITGAAATAGTQKLWNSNGGSNLPSAIYVVSPDLETGGTNAVDFGGRASGTQVANGGLINNPPAAGYDREGARYQVYTGAQTTTFVVPPGVTELRVRVIGAGGGGGGGGTNVGAAANTGGGGGGAGMVSEAVVAVTAGSSLSAVVGGGGTSGTAGVTGGNAGGNGGVGGTSSFGTSLAKANGGGGGAGGPASGTGSSGGGKYAQTGQITTVGVPGVGGVSQSPNGNGSTPIGPGVVGGGAGGAATASLGGGAGGAQTGSFPAFAAIGGGSGGASATASGVNGVTATTPGCGGGGGGGALTGGTGGAGGVGADGMVEIWW